MSLREEYREVFEDRFGLDNWIMTWPPGPDLKLGYAGKIEDGQFTRQYELRDSHVPKSVLRVAGPDEQPDTWNGSSSNAVRFESKAAGETSELFQGVAKGKLGLRLSFGTADSVAIVFRDIVQSQFQDERLIRKAMVDSFNGGPDPRVALGDFVVTQLLVAGWGFAYGAQSSDASVVLEFDADAKAPGGSELGTLSDKFKEISQHNTSLAVSSPGGKTGCVLGFRGVKLRQRFLHRPSAEPQTQAILAPGGADRRDLPAVVTVPVRSDRAALASE